MVDQLTNGFLDVSDEEFRILKDGLLQHNDEYFVLRILIPTQQHTRELISIIGIVSFGLK